MTQEEYIDLFHRAEVNLVAFKPVFHCENELRKMVEMAIEKEREACAEIAEKQRYAMNISLTSHPAQNGTAVGIANQIRARGQA